MYERKSSRHKASDPALLRWKRREIEEPPIHTCSYFLIRAIPRVGLPLMDLEMNDRRGKSKREKDREGRSNVPRKNTSSCSCEDGNRHPLLYTPKRPTRDLLLLFNCCACIDKCFLTRKKYF